MTRVTLQTEPLATIIKKPFNAEWVKAQLAIGNNVPCVDIRGDKWVLKDTVGAKFRGICGNYRAEKVFGYTIHILEPLPKHPKPEDAPLLYRYASEGLKLHGRYRCQGKAAQILGNDWREGEGVQLIAMCEAGGEIEITHCIDLEGNKVEVAIQEK